MGRRLVTVVAPARHHVADVDHVGALDGRCVDPLALDVLHLQAAGLVLIEQGDAAVIGVRAGALLIGAGRRLPGRVVDHAKHADGLYEALVEEVSLDAQGECDGTQKRAGKVLHVAVVPFHQLGPAFDLQRMTVGPAQWFAGQYLRMIGRHMETHVEGFLEVARLARVQLLGGDGTVAAVMAALGDIDLQLFVGGQGKETLGMVGEGGDALGADRMTLDIEEAPLAAGAVDGLRDGQMAGFVGVIERGNIDDGQ